MEKKIDILLTENGAHRSPFVAPEGYFDSLTSRIMDRIPEEQSSTETKIVSMHRLRPMRWAASIAAVIAIGAGIYFYSNNANNAANMAQAYDAYEEMNEAADYAMLDNYDIYSMLAEE